jgi:hypothetical protein
MGIFEYLMAAGALLLLAGIAGALSRGATALEDIASVYRRSQGM